MARDFGASNESQVNFNSNLLAENARIMMDRINGVAEPDVNVFNLAMSEKPRLSVFEYICPLEVAQTEVKTGSRKTAKRKRKHSAHGIRDRAIMHTKSGMRRSTTMKSRSLPINQGEKTSLPFITLSTIRIDNKSTHVSSTCMGSQCSSELT